MSSMLSFFDIFKKPFVFLFRQKQQSSTYLGFVLSMTLFFLPIYMFFTSDMLNKTNPIVNDQIITQDHASLITLSPENFEIAVGVTDYLGVGIVDPTIFTIDIIQFHVDFNSTTKKKYVSSLEYQKTIPCSQQSDLSEKFGWNNYLCLRNATLELEGMFDEKHVKAVVVKITLCNNMTRNNTCKSQAEIIKFFSDKSFWLYYQDTMYEVSNYENPIRKTWRIMNVDSSYGTPRVNNIFFRKLELMTDDNVLFSTTQKTKYGWIKEQFEGNSDYVMIDTDIITVNFLSSKNLQHCQRTYQKLGELIAIIGGFLNIIIIFSKFMTTMLNEINMKNIIMNSLYSYSFDDKMKKAAKIEERSEDWNENCEEGTNKTTKTIFMKFENNPQNTISLPQTNPLPTNLGNEDVIVPTEKDVIGGTNEEMVVKKIILPLQIQLKEMEKSKFVPLSKKFTSSPTLKQKELMTSQSAMTKSSQSKKDIFPLYLDFGNFMKIQIKLLFKMKLNQKESLFLVSDKKFREEIDIINILQKAQEIDLLSSLLLDKDQAIIMEHLAKSVINLENKNKKAQKLINNYFRRGTLGHFQEGNRNVQKKVIALKNYYEQLSKKSNLSLIEKNLMILIQETIFSE